MLAVVLLPGFILGDFDLRGHTLRIGLRSPIFGEENSQVYMTTKLEVIEHEVPILPKEIMLEAKDYKQVL